MVEKICCGCATENNRVLIEALRKETGDNLDTLTNLSRSILEICDEIDQSSSGCSTLWPDQAKCFICKYLVHKIHDCYDGFTSDISILRQVANGKVILQDKPESSDLSRL